MFSSPAKVLTTILAGNKMPFIAACLAVILVSGSLGTGLVMDDYLHRDMLMHPSRYPAGFHPITGLFHFISPRIVQLAMDYGTLPWWTDPELHIAFFRPLAAATHWLDYRLWPNRPALMHAHSLLWFGAMVLMAALVYRRTLTPLWAAGLATLLFAIDDAHGVPAGFLANRNALVAAVFGFAAIFFHIRWRRYRKTAGVVLGPLCFLAGLLSAEAGLGAGAYLLSYELFLVSGNWRKKATGLLPYALLTIIWWVIYHSLGFGASGSGFYIDPGNSPTAYLRVLMERAPVLLFGQWFIPEALLYSLLPKPLAYGFMAGTTVLLTGLTIALLPLIKTNPVARFWALGMVLALLPVCATIPHNRLLIFVGLGAMGLLAQFFAAWCEKGSGWPVSRVGREWADICIVLLAVVHLLAAPLLLPFNARMLAEFEEKGFEKPLLAISQYGSVKGLVVVFINPPFRVAGRQMRVVYLEKGLMPPLRTLTLASGSPYPMTIERIDDTTLEIEPQAGFLTGLFDPLFRGPTHPMQVGDIVDTPFVNAQVLSRTRDRRPLRVRFTFARPLDGTLMRFFEWRGGGYIPWQPPDNGQSVRLDGTPLSSFLRPLR